MNKIYEEFKKQEEEYLNNNQELINTVNKEVPQHILWAKTVCYDLEDDKAKTLTIDGRFYFTEHLVNKLMYFAYLKGTSNIEKESFAKGWEACWAETLKKLGVVE